MNEADGASSATPLLKTLEVKTMWFRKKERKSEYIGDVRDVLRTLAKSPEACRRLAEGLEINYDAESADFVRQVAENEANRCDAEQKESWAVQAKNKVFD